MKKIILFIALLLMPFGINAATTSDYYIEANILANGDIEVKELKVLEGDYNGIKTNLRFKNTGLKKFTGVLSDFEGSDIYNASAIADLKVYSLDQSNLTFDNVLDRSFPFTLVDYANKGEYGKYTQSDFISGTDLMIYMPSSYQKASLVTYTLKDVAVVHNDIAEVAWDFISNYEDDVTRLVIDINLPGESEELRVFSHGPLQGYNEIVSKSAVKATYPNINAYEAIDVRVVFDKELVSEATKKSNVDGMPSILEVEERRANQANEIREEVKKKYTILYALFSAYIIGAIIIAIRNYLKYDKEYKSNFMGDYYREFIDDYNVEVVDYLFNKSITPDAMSASIMNLIYKKNIEVEKDVDSKKDNDYKFTLKNTDKLNDTEMKLVKFLFETIGNKTTFTTKELKDYAKGSHYSTFISKYESWKSAVVTDGEAQEFYESHTKAKVVGILYALFGGVLYYLNNYYSTDIFLGYLLLPVAIVLFLYTIMMNKKTKKGVEHYSKWKAFKKFLNDFGNFSEKELPEVKLWERYMVYATVFGIASKVQKAMNVKIKELDPTGTIYTHTYFPIYNMNMSSTISNAVSTAVRQSVNSAVAKSSSSSSSGFGGGSSFGGGGFGGGGSGGGRF